MIIKRIHELIHFEVTQYSFYVFINFFPIVLVVVDQIPPLPLTRFQFFRLLLRCSYKLLSPQQAGRKKT